MSLGPLMISLAGTQLTEEDKAILSHPLIGGVILFSANYVSLTQMTELINHIRQLRQPALLIAVDHEGGKVQRFQDSFTKLPPAAALGRLYEQNPQQAVGFAQQVGWVLAIELRAIGVDFSFTPVLDLDYGVSQVIGDRAFHHQPNVVTLLARAVMQGMRAAGMMAVGKHFPGHGAVIEDSHQALPSDNRDFVDLQFTDLLPFENLIEYGLPAIMPAHVTYPKVDTVPVGFSMRWLQHILRQRLRFQGAIFSDDLSMAGAKVMGDVVNRTHLALWAGCDMVLICHDRAGVIQVLNQLTFRSSPISQVRLMRMRGKAHPTSWENLHKKSRWKQVQETCKILERFA